VAKNCHSKINTRFTFDNRVNNNQNILNNQGIIFCILKIGTHFSYIKSALEKVFFLERYKKALELSKG
jgi:hypothetical protein